MVICDLRFAICYLRFAICDLRFAICDLRFAICDLRFAICDLRFAICDLRFAICDLRMTTVLVVEMLQVILTTAGAQLLPQGHDGGHLRAHEPEGVQRTSGLPVGE